MAAWVAERVGIEAIAPIHALAVVSPTRMVGAVIYHGMGLGNVHMSIASETPVACSPGVVTFALGYPYQTWGCHRLTALCRPGNKPIKRLLGGLGFTMEGRLHAMAPDGKDMLIYGMTRKWWAQSRWGHRWRAAERQARAMLEAA